MKRNYLLVYHHKFIDKIEYEYYETLENLEKAIEMFELNKDITILNKYQIKEMK